MMRHNTIEGEQTYYYNVFFHCINDSNLLGFTVGVLNKEEEFLKMKAHLCDLNITIFSAHSM